MASLAEEDSESAYAPIHSPVAELRQILALLFLGAVPDDGQRADAHVRAEGHRKAGQFADGFGDQREVTLSISRPP
jgi:hypothetical protein